MKFTAAIFAVGALAAVRRQSGGLAENIEAITTATNAVTSAIEAYNGDIQEALAVNSATGDVLTAIQAAQSTVDAATAISGDEAISLVGPTGELNMAVESSIDALIAKQPIFSSNGLSGAVLQSLQTQQEASTALTSAIVAKLPEGLQDAGRQSSQPAADAIARGIAAYMEGGSDDGGSSSAAPSASATASVTGTLTTQIMMPTMPAAGGNATATSSMPMQYTGAAAAQQVVGLGALALGVVVAAF
ncbi:hypothetical protein CERZMDRAFT_90717 [Cercospora zeae-maydis SCOH1-5]|uniref:Cell wall protein n=1 Tax=Cercospora zeae-maydis SCOH1-5 TaxID=717836 RepID=A0A6A6FFK3_9PEZI|nr:hypothetical protein CERZMDRAFT_90717 [Cercospora zeae-maydis SCOH1-5]